jgi:DNA invertase Pin-like site-specific DNA recombinase
MPRHRTTPESAASMGTAHPYARISEREQRKGGGLVRQVAEADDKIQEFCRLFGFAQSPRVRVDDGVSAFEGLNASSSHELGKFLIEAQGGVIRPGDCLLIVNYDRLSRQNPWAAISLVHDLRQFKIHIGRLDKMKLLRHDSTDVGDFFEAAIEFLRGNSESTMKSFRNGNAWNRKRRLTRDKGTPLTRRLPH